MGRVFLEYLGGKKQYLCAICSTQLSNKHEVKSTRFTGSTGRAILFKRAVNVTYLKAEKRVMLTGKHVVRDVLCKCCDARVGWMYEFASEEDQKYKEGLVILERALIKESHGFDEERLDTLRDSK